MTKHSNVRTFVYALLGDVNDDLLKPSCSQTT